jgi:hypothetical protein
MKIFPLLLPLLLAGSAWSAEYQRLTFSDGAVKVGYFDERKGTLTLDDGATIAVKVDDIVRRETIEPRPKPLEIPPPPTGPSDPGGKDAPGQRGASAPETDRTR